MKNNNKNNKNNINRNILLIIVAGIIILYLVVVTVTDRFNSGNTPNTGSASSVLNNSNKTKTISEGVNLSISKEDINSDVALYPIEVDGTQMEIIAVKDLNGEIRGRLWMEIKL